MTQVVKVEPPDHHLGDSSLATGPCFFSVLYTIPISSALVLCFLFQASLPSSEFIYLAALGLQFSLVQFSHSVLSNSLRPLWVAAPGLPVHHHLPEFTQTHVHRVGEAIKPSHPVSSPSPPAPNPSQQQGLFQWRYTHFSEFYSFILFITEYLLFNSVYIYWMATVLTSTGPRQGIQR